MKVIWELLKETFTKWQEDKAARLADRAKNPADRVGLPAGVDPDIADIRPGPQPLADWQIDPEEKPEEA